jgi:hypothetical protein
VTDTSRQRLGALDQITLRMPIKVWRKVLENYRPGSVVRIQTKERLSSAQDHGVHVHVHDAAANDEDRIFESVFAIAQCDTPGEIQVLVARPDPSLRWEVRRVAELLRAPASPSDGALADHSHTTPKGPHRPTFYINPAISGFYNSRYEYIMDEVERASISDKDSGDDDREKGSTIEDVVVVATGSGLSGALSAVEALVSRNQSILNKATTNNKGRRASTSAPIRIHLYYGLRDVNNLSYADRLGKLVQSGSIQLTLVQSKDKHVSRSGEQSPEAITDAEKRGQASTSTTLNKELTEAVARGETIKAKIDVKRNQLVTSETEEHADSTMHNGKVYVQHVLQHALTQLSGPGDPSASPPLEKFAFVVCGRMHMTDDVRAILKRLCRPENEADREGQFPEQSQRLVEKRLFVNI